MKPLTLALCAIAVPALAQQGTPGRHFIENWDLNQDGAVTAAEAAERRGDIFYTFDSNEDGFLDGEEYALFDQARANDMENQPGHGRGGMKRAADGMVMDRTDTDGDGKVSRKEFVETAGSWIDSLDRDGDGVVTAADFGPARG